MSFNRRRKGCRWTAAGVTKIDYKDPRLMNFVSNAFSITPRRNTATRAPLQRQLALAIKRARFLSLLGYCDTH